MRLLSDESNKFPLYFKEQSSKMTLSQLAGIKKSES
jgi:hypothetical protein